MVLSTTLPSPIPSSTPAKHSSSSSCGSKKTRKGSFGQSAKTTSANEVGDFQGGYFVMPMSPSSPSKLTTQSNKSSHSSSYDKKNKRFETPQRDVGISPPKNTYDYPSSSSKSEATPSKKTSSSRKVNTTPKACSVSPSTSPSSSFIQASVHASNTPSNNTNSISTKLHDASSSRWAGPAFSNAPPPSSLPLPSFPPLASFPSAQSAIPPSVTQYPQHHYHIQSIPPPPVSYSLDHKDPSSLSVYSFPNMLPSLDSTHHQPAYVHHPHDESSWYHHMSSHPIMMSSANHHQHDEKVPPASYPSYAPLPLPPSASPVVSLADLSTDLRRMLNISSSPAPSSATMMSDHRLLGSRLIPVHSS